MRLPSPASIPRALVHAFVHAFVHGFVLVFVPALMPAPWNPARAQSADPLAQALTFHAPFDAGLAASFSIADREPFVRSGTNLIAASVNDEVVLVPGGGRYGGALRFTRKGKTWPQFKGTRILGYRTNAWNATVSVWLRLDPDKDLEPGYCDPIQIIGNDTRQGFIFLEWSKDETPRYFRYAVRPVLELWNPGNRAWADIPFGQRPMVQVDRAPFSRQSWTHVAFTLENINAPGRNPRARLYLNARLMGTIDQWNLTLGWLPDSVALVLGAAYVGDLDDLAVFNRALSSEEIGRLQALPGGVADLHPPVPGTAAPLRSNSTYSEAYGKTRNAVTLDPARELPRYPAVEPSQAPSTWKLRPGFRMELAAHEPQVRDPIALCFDERGRMFVCEMIDYSEMRDSHPHLGRVSILEDRDGDGRYETSRVFADNLPWPTGLLWAGQGLYVAATPDIWRFEDRDGDGVAESRVKAFTGFGVGLQRLNVQSMLNSLQWGQDNRIHVLAGGGNRGTITSPLRPDLPAVELGGRDFWFDPASHDFGLEAGGAQYGMSFDDFGRKFGCSNSDHLQYWVYDGDPGLSGLPPSRQSIAVDGGAAEVYRISPDEPWRIVRTRWRISGTVPGMVEGGGRVSGYFTGATGTTLYRGDAFGPGWSNHSFTGDAGGQLIHHKIIQPAPDGVNLEGRRPAEEQGVEFAASTDTWVRVVNFANAPDGCLYVCDMYREVIEHPWSIPDEIKRHLDLNSGNDRGRIWRVLPAGGAPRRGQRVNLATNSSAELVTLLSHPNGWHRDTAQRLLRERQTPTVIPNLAARVESPGPAVPKLHALSLLDAFHQLNPATLQHALADPDPTVRERALALLAVIPPTRLPGFSSLWKPVAHLAADRSPRVRFQLAFTLGALLAQPTASTSPDLAAAYLALARQDHAHPWIGPALLRTTPDVPLRFLLDPLTSDPAFLERGAGFIARLVELHAASRPAAERPALVALVARHGPRPDWLDALASGLKRTGSRIADADPNRQLDPAFLSAAADAANPNVEQPRRVRALRILAHASPSTARAALEACLQHAQPVTIQTTALRVLLQDPARAAADTAIRLWPGLGPQSRQELIDLLLLRPERCQVLLAGIDAGTIAAASLTASQVQAATGHKDPSIAERARRSLASVIPPSRDEVAAQYRNAATTPGNAARGHAHYVARCANCHRAAGQGTDVGPDLITVKSRGRDALLTAILDPSREVAAQYIAYDITTRDGETHTGFIAEDTATAVTLRIAGGSTHTIPRARIQGTTSGGRSLMPDGLETGLSVQDMADLLSFIEALK